MLYILKAHKKYNVEIVNCNNEDNSKNTDLNKKLKHKNS